MSPGDLSAAAAQVSEWLGECDRVLIGAGAGLSAAAGIDYTDPVSFARLFPAMVRRGFRARHELIGYPGLSPAAHWGYWATHVADVRYGPRPHPAYGRLLDLVSGKDYFVLTSNVDAMFPRNGFDETRLYAPQGDYASMQCLAPCRSETWETWPVLEGLLPAIDPMTQEVTDTSLIPRCPNCGGEVFMNVRAGHWFVEEPSAEQMERFMQWMRGALEQPLLVIEIGAGFNTPSVVRWPMERIVYSNLRAQFVRINLSHPEVPDGIADRSVSINADAAAAVDTLWRKGVETGSSKEAIPC
jgi:NAD-dependent SIR2 family protein deacetylase